MYVSVLCLLILAGSTIIYKNDDWNLTLLSLYVYVRIVDSTTIACQVQYLCPWLILLPFKSCKCLVNATFFFILLSNQFYLSNIDVIFIFYNFVVRDLSNNRLSGPVPDNGSFSLFTPIRFSCLQFNYIYLIWLAWTN